MNVLLAHLPNPEAKKIFIIFGVFILAVVLVIALEITMVYCSIKKCKKNKSIDSETLQKKSETLV